MSGAASEPNAIEIIDTCLQQIVSALSDGGLVLTRWLVVWEVSDANGRLPELLGSEGLMLQDTAGLLDWAKLDIERAIRAVLDAKDGG